jgi:hypothetical protein
LGPIGAIPTDTTTTGEIDGRIFTGFNLDAFLNDRRTNYKILPLPISGFTRVSAGDPRSRPFSPSGS